MTEYTNDKFAIYNGDCVDVTKELPDNSVDLSVYSPPFSSLFTYSESERDLSNCKTNEEFFNHYKYLIKEKYRITKSGRLSVVHCKDFRFASTESHDGSRGMVDFTGDLIRAHIECGWTYHARVTVWRDPEWEAKKNKPDNLLYKNFRNDAARVSVGMPEYLIVFRKWEDDMKETPPVMHDYIKWREWAGEGEKFAKSGHLDGHFEKEYSEARDIWQSWASPVWMDTDMHDVVKGKFKYAKDERHLTPTPKDLIERAIRMWSNEGDVVFSPFLGVGSEGIVSIKTGRKFIGIELKPEYFQQAYKNIQEEYDKNHFGKLL